MFRFMRIVFSLLWICLFLVSAFGPVLADAGEKKLYNPFERQLKAIEKLEEKYSKTRNDQKRKSLERELKDERKKLESMVERMTAPLEKQIAALERRIDKTTAESTKRDYEEKLQEKKEKLENIQKQSRGVDVFVDDGIPDLKDKNDSTKTDSDEKGKAAKSEKK